MKHKAFILLISFILTTTALLSGCGSFHGEENAGTDSGLERFSDVYFDAFDTVTSVIAYSESQEAFDEMSDEIHKHLMTYHRLFDIYKTYEGINNARTINKNAGEEPVPVDPELIELVELGKELYEVTNGKVNIAMGAVLSLWHDARIAAEENPEDAYIPDMEELKEASKHCNIEDVIVDKEAGTIFLKDPEMALDLGAIGKGFAVEKAVEKMEDLGYSNFVISAGGNVRTSGSKADGSPWSIAVQNPNLDDEEYIDILEMTGGSLVTSGVYQRFFEYDGEKYHHIIDPDTLMPSSRYLSVSIVTDDSGLADALSTGVFNMELEEGQVLIESMEGTEAMWVLPDMKIVESSGWKS